MKISREDESTLVLLLTELIPNASVTHYGAVSLPARWENQAQEALSENFRDQLYKHLDDGGLVSFFRRYVAKTIIDGTVGFPEKSEGARSNVALVKYPEFADPLSAARKMVAFLGTLPLQYEIAIPIFPDIEDRFPSDLDLRISDRMRMEAGVRVAERFEVSSGSVATDNLYSSFKRSSDSDIYIRDDIAYLTYRTSGFVSDIQRPSCFLDFYDDVRAFYGACMAFDICEHIDFLSSKENIIVVGNLLGEKREFAICEVAENDIRDATNSFFQPDEDKLEEVEGVAKVFQPIIRMFGSAEVDRLRTAAIWLLRSNLSNRGMDTILDASIAIEVLLGDRNASDRIGLSKLMANRCAYSLGKSAKERTEIHDFFTLFYRVRSEIVHSGRLAVSKDEEAVVRKGVGLAARILRHEITMG